MVPFAKGDEDGLFTAELAQALAASGLFDVVNRGGDYLLSVCLGPSQHDVIGFRRDPQRIKNEVKKNLVRCEGRRTLAVEVTLLSAATGQPIGGPFTISADADYDYVDGDSYPQLTFVSKTGETVVVLPFSLGQLESVEAAQEATLKPLYRKISQKIVDVISAEW
jgi:hypothetical protein